MKSRIKVLAGCAILVLIDQLSKLWVLRYLKGRDAIPLIPGVFELLYVENRGAAFGILQNKQWVFLIIGILVLALLLWLLPGIPGERRYLGMKYCLYFVGAGAVGNMIDRIFRGYVVDFLYFKLIDFPVFNVADIYVTTSCFILIVLVVFFYKDEDFNRMFAKRPSNLKK
ncbi:MAG: signal peptidase II [Clostridiales bacterium]|nr:signal peptidase II [Clostridiales bacterium]